MKLVTWLIAAALLTFAPLAARAFELGALRLDAGTGSSMNGQILLRQGSDNDPVMAWVVSAQGYRAAGLEPRADLADVRINAQRVAPGDTRLRVDGLPVTGAAYDLLVIAADSSGSRVGRYRIDIPRLARGGAREVAVVPLSRQVLVRGGEARASPGSDSQASPAGPDAQAGIQLDAQVRAAVEAWRDAWSRRDVDAYLAAYAPDYSGRSPEQTRAQWVRERTARIRDRQQIDVQISDLQFAERAGMVLASFAQTYRSDGIVSRSRKQFVLRELGGRWLIVQETELR
jgi:ketosteroid isomerase-like protein